MMGNPAPSRWWRWFCGLLLALGAAGFLAGGGRGLKDLPLQAVKLALLCLFLGFLLRALCLGRPPFGRLMKALALLSLPLACYFLFGLLIPVHLRSPYLAFLFPAGLLLALFALRGTIREAAFRRKADRIRSILVVLALAGGACLSASSYQALFHAQALAEEQAAQMRPAPRAYAGADEERLGPHNARTVEGPFRNIDLSARLVLEQGAILQVRVRAPQPEWPRGISLFLSADDRFATGFYLETRDAFTPLGEPSGPLPADLPLALEIRTRARHFEALVNGSPVASAQERIFAEGGVILLAARGFATIGALRIEPADYEESASSSLPDRLKGAAAPLLFLLAFAWPAAFFMKVPILRMLEASAFGLAPVGYGFHYLSPRGAMDVWLLAWSLLAASLLFLLLPMIHSRRLSGPRYFALVLIVLLGNGWMFMACSERSWPRDFTAISRLSVADWSGDRLEEDFLHFQHPLLRRWNPYLARHELRGRAHELEKAPGATRILALGTSSTHGYWMKLPYAFRLELLLKKEGFAAETMIGAFPGGTGPRLYYYFRNVLLDFSPDVVTLSLYYNDAFDLTQMDEAAYLRRIARPGYHRSLFDRIRDRILVWLGAGRLEKYLREFSEPADRLDPGEGTESPVLRFESMLRDFAVLARARGAALVLVKEPVAGGKDRLWKGEFYAAMDRVGRAFDLPVVDPTPLLNEHGGAGLFVDNIHPSEEGAQLIAESLLPVVKVLLAD